MRKIFITGICGFVGSSLASFFYQKNYQVSGIDNLSRNRKKNISKFKIKEMQKRYIFTIFYVWIEKILLQRDLKRD